MPDNGLEDVLGRAQLSADERRLLDKVLQNNTELRDGWLRQSDYSRRQTELQKKQREYDEAISIRGQVQAWWDEKKPLFESLADAGAIDDEGNPVWPDEKKRLQKEMEELRAAAVAGADMNPEELNRRVSEIVKQVGGVTQEEMKALVQSEAKKLAEEAVTGKYNEFQKVFNEKTIPFTAGISAANALAALDYERITGEEFTPEKQDELFRLMAKENNYDPRAMMKVMVKPVLEKKATEDEIERRVRERLAKESREGDQFIPQDIGGDERTMGSLKRMLEQSVEEGDLESQVMAAGRKAAAELRLGK